MRQFRYFDPIFIGVLCVHHMQCLRRAAQRSDLRPLQGNTTHIIINNPDDNERSERFERTGSCKDIDKYKQFILPLTCEDLSKTAQGIRAKLITKEFFTMMGAASHGGVSVGDAVGGAVGESASAILLVDNAEVTVNAFRDGTSAVVSSVTNEAVTNVSETVQNAFDPSDALQTQILRTNGTYSKVQKAWTVGSILLIATAVVGDVLSGGATGGGLTATALTASTAGGIAFSLADGVFIAMQKQEVNKLNDCFNTICVFENRLSLDIFSDVESSGNNSVGRCDCKGTNNWWGCANPYGFRSSCTQWHNNPGMCELETAFWSEPNTLLCAWT